MNQITFYIVMTAIIAILFCIFLGGMIFLLLMVAKHARLKKNPIDIDIFEFNKTGCVTRHEIGRKEFHKDYGFCIVTAGKGKKIKEYVSNTISDNDLIPLRGKGWFDKGRKYMAVAVKDGVFASLSLLEKDTDTFTDAELAILNSFVTHLQITENPKYFSLSPVKSEQTRFVLDINSELQEKYLNDDNIELGKRLLKNAMWVIGVGLIVILIMFIILMTQGGSLVNALPKTPIPPG